MNLKKKLLVALALSTLVVFTFQNCGQGFQLVGSSEDELNALASDSLKIRQQHCARCHDGATAQAEPSRILDDQFLIANKWVVPGDPASSPIYTSLFDNMPLNSPRLSDTDVEVLEAWIVSLANDGTKPAKLTLSDGPLFDFGTVMSGASAEHTFTLTNEGERESIAMTGTGLAAPFEYKGGAFPGTGGTCLVNLPAQENCTIVVLYAPSAAGTHNDTMEILYLDRNARAGRMPSLASLPLTGTATGAANANLALSDGPNYDFGIVGVSTNAQKIFTLTNNGLVAATNVSADTMNGAFAFVGGAYPGTGGTCSTSLAAAANCTLAVQFAPTSNGKQNSSLVINYKSGALNLSTSVSLVGNGTGAGTPIYHSEVRSILAASSCNSCHSADWGSSYAELKSFKLEGSTAAITPGSATSRFIKRISTDSAGKPQMGAGTFGTLTTTNRDKIISWIMMGAPDDPSAPPAVLTLSANPSYDFGNVTTGSSKDNVFTVQNTGGMPATMMTAAALNAPFSYKGGAYPGTGGNCADTLAASAACTVVVMFAPTATTTSTGSLSIGYNDGTAAKTVTRAMTGTGQGPALANLSLSDTPEYDFGVTSVSAGKDKTFTVTNSGSAAASGITGTALTAPFSFKGGSFPGTGGNCAATLAVGANCKIVVRYAPTTTAAHTGTLNVSYNDGATSKNTSTQIKGMGGGGITVTYSEVRAILDSSCMTCHSSDWGSTHAALRDFKKSGSTTAILAGDASSRFIDRIVNDSTTKPKMGAGSFGSLSVANRDKIIAWILAGANDDPPSSPAVLAINNGPTFDFGNVTTGSSKDQTFTIENTGGSSATTLSPAALPGPFSFKGGSYPGATGTCSATLIAGASCTVVVSFTPTATTTSTATLTLNYNDSTAAKTATRAMTGTGQGPALANLALSETSFTFGVVAVNSGVDKTITITNNGSAAATSLAMTGLGAPITYKGGTYPGTGGNCATSLAVGANCKVVVRFAPTANGAFSKTLTVNYHNGQTARSATLALSGTGAGGGTAIFYSEVRTILNGSSCNSCHGSEWGTNYAGLMAFKKEGTTSSILASNANSRFIVRITTDSPKPRMGSPGYGNLSTANRDKIVNWILQGAKNDPATPPAVLAINQGPTFNFGTVTSGQVKDQSFTVSNSGGSSASSMAAVALAAPFSFKGGTYPGTGGTCGTDLAPAANCTIVVRFAPSAAAVSNATLRVNYNDGTAAKNTTRAMTGTGQGIPLANLAFNGAVTVDFGMTGVSKNSEKTFTLNNSGAAAATAMSAVALTAPFKFKGGTYPGTGGTCAATLAVSASCTIIVQYSPTANGAHTGSLRVNYNDGTAAKNALVNLEGRAAGGGPAILYSDVRTILTSSCLSCHSSEWGATYTSLMAFKKEGTTAAILASNGSSRFIARISNATADKPRMGATDFGNLSVANRDKIINWIMQGAKNDPVAPPASLTLSDGPTYNFGDVTSGASKDKALTVTNSGGQSATTVTGAALTAPFSFKGGSYPGTGGTCSATILASASCTVVVTFTPSSATTSNGTVTLNYNDGTGTKSAARAVTGRGLGPSLATLTLTNSPTYAFGMTNVGTVKDRSFTLRNTGAAQAKTIAAVALAAPFRFKGTAFPGTGGTCAATLNAGATCTIVVQYAPTANGNHTGTLRVNYNDGAAAKNVSVALTGSGAGGGPAIYYSEIRTILTSSCMSCHNADWGTTYAGLKAFKKEGSTPAITAGSTASRFITRISTDSPKSQMGINGFGSLSAANRTKIINWILQGALNDPASSPASLAINNGPTFDFGSVTSGSNKDQSFTVNNSGGSQATAIASVALSAPFSFKGGSYPGTGGTCGTTLNAGANCTVVVRFAPTAAAVSTGTLRLNYNDGTASANTTRALRGTGQGVPLASLTLSGTPTLAFGTAAAGATVDKTVTVTNSGAAQAKSMSGAAIASPFKYKGGTYPGTGGTCAATLNAAATCTVVLQFAPTANGAFNKNFSLNYNNGQASQTVTLALSGTGAGGGTIIYYSEVRAILDRSSCNGCHSADWGTSYATLRAFKKAPETTNSIVAGNVAGSRFATRITAHTTAKPQMGVGDFGSLTTADRQKLLDWIAQGALNNPAGTISQDYRPLAGDRYYVASVLKKVFGPSATANNKFRTTLTPRADLFGSPCFPQDGEYTTATGGTRVKNYPIATDTCLSVGTEEGRLGAESTRSVSTVSEAVRQSACMRLLDEPTLTASALTLSGLASNSAFDSANITKAYQRFYPGTTPSPGAVSALISVGETAVSRTSVTPAPSRTKTFEGWRFIYLSLCLSSGWQTP